MDKRLLANRRYEALARRRGQSLQAFFATGNMAHADAVEAGVGIDPDRRAYHVFIKSGLTDDQINHDHRLLWILESFRKLCSGSTTNPRTWTDTVSLWAGIQDL